MIILSATTDSISITTSSGSAYDTDAVCTYIDRITANGVVGAADRQLTNFATASTADVVNPPASGFTRNVKTMNFRNAHATSAVDILVMLDANGTLYELHKATLLAGESLSYIENIGFFKLSDTARAERILVMDADSVHATAATFANITGLTVPLKAGVLYGIFCCLHHINNASTTGAQFGYNIGAAPTDARLSTIDTVTASVTASVHSAGSITARDTAITAQTTGSAVITLAIIAGFIIPSAGGTFAMRATSEVTVAAGLTVKAGSFLRVFRPTG